VFVQASSLPDALRRRWWLPSAQQLDAIVAGRASVKLLVVELDDSGGADLWSARSVWVSVEERNDERFAGTVTHSAMDRDGLREGERVSAPLDRIFDWVLFDERGEPLLNEDRARFALGKRVLAGVTTVSPAGEVVERRQFVGTLVAAVAARGLELKLDDGSHYWLPPDTRALEEAAPGEYRLRSADQVVIDPDYVCAWTVELEDDSSALSDRGFERPPLS